MSETDARLEARRRFGSVLKQKKRVTRFARADFLKTCCATHDTWAAAFGEARASRSRSS